MLPTSIAGIVPTHSKRPLFTFAASLHNNVVVEMQLLDVYLNPIPTMGIFTLLLCAPREKGMEAYCTPALPEWSKEILREDSA